VREPDQGGDGGPGWIPAPRLRWLRNQAPGQPRSRVCGGTPDEFFPRVHARARDGRWWAFGTPASRDPGPIRDRLSEGGVPGLAGAAPQQKQVTARTSFATTLGPRTVVRQPTLALGLTGYWGAGRQALTSTCALVVDPVARAGSEAGGAVVGIGQLAAVEREAAAADAFRQPELQALQFGDPVVDPRGPGGGESRPVSARGRLMKRKLGKLGADLIER